MSTDRCSLSACEVEGVPRMNELSLFDAKRYSVLT